MSKPIEKAGKKEEEEAKTHCIFSLLDNIMLNAHYSIQSKNVYKPHLVDGAAQRNSLFNPSVEERESLSFTEEIDVN